MSDAGASRVLHLHLVSDSTGETVHGLARACVVQFANVEPVEHIWSLIRTKAQIDKVINTIRRDPGIVMYTMVDDSLRAYLIECCRELHVPCLSVLDPFMNAFSSYLGQTSQARPGKQHTMDAEYFSRIEAMQYALAHDDGQGLWNLHAADVVLTGVSRTSKTPTCIYLANRGLKAANVPFVPLVGPPPELLALKDIADGGPLVVGLTKDPASLVQIRKNRLRMISDDDQTDYVDLETVREEVKLCRRLCGERDWPVIDVTRRSIEETAAAIVKHYEKRVVSIRSH